MDQQVISFFDVVVEKGVVIAVAVAIALVAQRLIIGLANKVLENSDVPNASIFINILKTLIWSFALLSIMKPVFNVDPSGLIAALGVVSVAISLGLQDTISNIVGGLGLMVSRAVRPGDRVTVGSTSGVVTDVTWRSTTLRTRGGDVDVIPNSVLNKTTLTHIADANAGVCKVPFAVAPDADLDAVATEVRAAVAEALGSDLNPQYQTGVNFAELTAYGTQGEVVLHVVDGVGFPSAKNRVAHALHGRPWLARAV